MFNLLHNPDIKHVPENGLPVSKFIILAGGIASTKSMFRNHLKFCTEACRPCGLYLLIELNRVLSICCVL